MITHIKSINEDFNIVTVFLYLGEKHHKDINSNEKDKANINDILCEDVTKSIIGNFNIFYENVNGENADNYINNNNLNNSHANINFIENLNDFNAINNLALLNQNYTNNDITSNLINNMPEQNYYSDKDIYNNYPMNNTSINLLNKICELENLNNNLEFSKIENSKEN